MELKEPVWRKSRRSGGGGGNCVELADLGAVVGIRDSKNPAGGHLTVSRHELAAFVGRIKADQV